MWHLTDGLQKLRGVEADLFRGGVGMVMDRLVEQLSTDDPVEAAQIADAWDEDQSPRWFAMWEPDQKVWLLERVATAVLTAGQPPPPAAIFDATIETIYAEIADLVAIEVIDGEPIAEDSWRQTLLQAFTVRCPRASVLEAMRFQTDTLGTPVNPAGDSRTAGSSAKANPSRFETLFEQPDDWLTWWTRLADRLLDATYGPRLYHDAEAHRDGDPNLMMRFLDAKGTNRLYLRRIPPLRSHNQTQAAVDRLQALVFED